MPYRATLPVRSKRGAVHLVLSLSSLRQPSLGTAQREVTATKASTSEYMRYLSEVIIHAGFDDVLTLCD